MIHSLGALAVGLVLLWTGALKALSPDPFFTHIQKLGWIPRRFIRLAVELSAGAEAALGAALIVGFAPSIVLPFTIVTLIALALVTWVSIRSGRATDCGCYGGYVVPSLTQTMAINALLVLLVAISWRLGVVSPVSASTGLIITASAGVIFGGFAAIGLHHAGKYGKPLVDLSPIKAGHVWHNRWAGQAIADHSDEVIVAYLGTECPFCKIWIPILNAINEKPELPRVVGIVGEPSANLEDFRAKAGIRFPTDTISRSLMSRLVTGVPTTVIVKDGHIDDVWKGQMSPTFLERFKEAFFPGAKPLPQR